jgi:hypothetical protein
VALALFQAPVARAGKTRLEDAAAADDDDDGDEGDDGDEDYVDGDTDDGDGDDGVISYKLVLFYLIFTVSTYDWIPIGGTLLCFLLDL